MRQRAIVVNSWTSDANGNLQALMELAQAGESVMDYTGTPSDQIPPATNCVLAEVWAEEERITALDGLAAYRVLWRQDHPADDTPAGTSTLEPDEPMATAEITALRDYLETRFGWTVDQIANWFDVDRTTLVNWLRNHTRREVVEKLRTAFRQLRKS